jgi:hypothetical protein
MTYTAWTPFGCDPGCNGTLTVDSFSLNTPGWMVYNLSSLWFEANYRGTNRPIPRYPGTIGYPKRLDPYDFSLVFWVTGLLDGSGAPWSDPWEGLEQNLEDLWDAVFSPVTSGDGARGCTLTTPSGTDRTARVQFQPLRKNAEITDATLAEFVMSGTILEGRFSA